ncbi:hypothetical protein OIU34_23130 [Pararhizobium sp. BT-229]|uniref:hypothetical protein n=1 Tax=Pararhizobium sp. BT-229 TaxID=2986923 RepID=UPI0021F7419B|nr:hypothetical protein [Pararhizobium sp. BT-229]MCV9964789.1 hypothetical protein [Pararhizobium sp. BT-229]
MTPIELQRAAGELFPENGKGTLADALGVDYSTSWRYYQRETVPGPVAAAVTAWLRLSLDFDLTPPSKPCEMRDLDEMVELASPGIRKQSGLSGIEAAAFLVFGDGWKRSLAQCLSIDASTLWRQIVHDNVSGPVAAAVRAWLLIWRLTGERPVVPSKPEKPSKKKVPTYARLLLD